MGKALLYNFTSEVVLAETISAKAVEKEIWRLENAVKKSQAQLKKIHQDLQKIMGKDSAFIIETQYMLLKDSHLLGRDQGHHPEQAGQGRMGHQGSREEIPGALPHHPRPLLQGQEQRHLRRAEPPDRQPAKKRAARQVPAPPRAPAAGHPGRRRHHPVRGGQADEQQAAAGTGAEQGRRDVAHGRSWPVPWASRPSWTRATPPS